LRIVLLPRVVSNVAAEEKALVVVGVVEWPLV
jgi:hypothetical protein